MRGSVFTGRAGARPLIASRSGNAPLARFSTAIPRVARATSPLSAAQLAELVEGNRRLRALLEGQLDALPADQVDSLRRQYDEARALAASNGLELEPLPPARAGGAAAGGKGGKKAGGAGGARPETAAGSGAREAGGSAGGAGGSQRAAAPAAGKAASSSSSGGGSGSATPAPVAPAEPEAPATLEPAPSATAASAAPPAEAEHWIDDRGRAGGEDADRLSPRLTPEQEAARAAREAAQRAEADALVSSHDPAAVAESRHHWLVFTVPERPVAGADCVVYFNKRQSGTLGFAQRVSMQVGYNAWQLGGEKLPLAPAAVPSVDGSEFWAAKFKVPAEAFELNCVFGDDYGNHDNNLGKDFTFPTEGGLSFEEWLDSAADRAARAEQEEAAARAAAAAEAAAAAAEAALARDEAEAVSAVDELRGAVASLREGALAQREAGAGGAAALLWTTAPAPLRAGARGTLLYNSRAGPLAWLDPAQGHAAPCLTYGFNNWRTKGAAPIEMKPSSAVPAADDQLWWEASVDLPPDAACLNFCVNSGDCWDNNGGGDHKALVSPPPAFDASPDPTAAWLDSLVPPLRAAARARREAAEAEAAAKEAKRAEERGVLRNRALAVTRRQLRHVLFTEPEVIRAGEKVTVYYSPASTNLAGREQIHITAGFNRWGHLRKLGPAAMKPPGQGGMHHRATFMVPRDAHMLDVVLSDGEGSYDNRGGLDYHLPVAGGVGARPQPLHVVHIAVEMAPIAKVGGLGDVVTSLGRAVQDQGHMVEAILPCPSQCRCNLLTTTTPTPPHVVVTSCVVEGIRVFFVDPHNGFFHTDSVYGRNDDEMRFDFFCKAALEFLLQTQRQPDILHCHDWQTAHVAKAYWDDYHPFGLWKPNVVFTIHNMNYGQRKIGEAAYYSQKFTTVSPTYAAEVGGHPAIAGHGHKFMGILNGIDPELWDPAEDPWLPVPYGAANCEEGKAAARAELRRRLGMNGWEDKLLVAVVSRLTGQKGVPLIKHAAWRSRDRGGQFVLLGSAPDPRVQGEFNALAGELSHGGDAAFCFYYDEPLSHLIYAAADIVVVPSMFEPCGLTQMIAMRYGAVPVVRHTGGLRDTVFDVDNDKARAAWEVAGSTDPEADGPTAVNGFAFEGADAGGLDYALNRAIDAYYNDKAWFRGLQSRVMGHDVSWCRPAVQYVDLYYAAIKK
ncbi:glycosyltransferase [Raphidocelis subcapitata]|uniref:starch synthase n=1 Tax=Raphidocelis subcapitata TaxID=307507 RepID=A0A2V0PC49_9CHLO|nr:glycosyltransferase [Raphidocelis subcapitata]|eukprot:GBF95473.1 glycosyltransferase [Raphidocelis subcapitata]